MMEIKDGLITIVITVLIIQIGKIFIKQTSFFGIYKSVSGIVLFILFFNLLTSYDISSININKNTGYNNHIYNDNIIIKEFQKNLKNKIENDIHNVFYVNTVVNIYTDLSFIKIHISGSFQSFNEDKIKEYVFNKYCKQGDEVTITDESS